MRKHFSDLVQALQGRFDFIRQATDAHVEAPRIFVDNHRAELYKAFLKSFVSMDGPIAVDAIRLAAESFDGGTFLVYPMLHLPRDTNEEGYWHRDGASNDRRVFWIPLTRYAYRGLSYVPLSDGPLSRAISFVGSHMRKLPLPKRDVDVDRSVYYSWSPRLVHRGNLNTSDALSCALVIFLDRTVPKAPDHREPLTESEIARCVKGALDALEFDSSDRVAKVSKEQLTALPEEFRSRFLGFFALRTKVDLNALD